MVALISRIFLSSSTSIWTFLFILLLISYDSASMPHCVKDCNRYFANDAALSRHHKACLVLKNVRQRSQDIRRDKGIGGLSQNSATLATRKQRLQASDPVVFCDLVLDLQILQAHLIGTAPGTGSRSTSAAMEVDEPEEGLTVSDSSDSLANPSSTFQLTDYDAPLPFLPTPPLLTQSGRPRRDYRLPKRFQDNLPEPPAPVPNLPSNPIPEPHPVRRVILIVRDRLVTVVNSFGIWRDYPERPSVDPDALLTIEDLSNRRDTYKSGTHPSESDSSPESRSSYWPFSNATIHTVMQWMNNGQTMKSEAETTKFIHNVILSPTFDPADLAGFDAHRENQRLDKALLQESALRSQFTESSVNILVPSGESNIDGKTFTVPGLLHRKLTSVIREAFEGPLAHLYHYSPFKLFQKSPISEKEERIYGEIFTSDAFLEETESVQRHGLVPPEDPGCKREKVVAALMVSSDATMLTQFGVAKGWPIYLMFGNLSKYIRAQPGSGAMHHLAYIPSVSFSGNVYTLFDKTAH
jgi:hypothetical protein